MAMPAHEFTSNHEPVTDRELRGRLDHLDNLIHLILTKVEELSEIATPEARAMLAKFTSNPAVRFAAGRRNGTKP